MGKLTWCENCGVVTNNSLGKGGYVNRTSVDNFGLAVTLCHKCEDDLQDSLEHIFGAFKAYETPKSE